MFKLNKQEVDRRMENFTTVCRDSGAKLTHQRLEIFREVAQTGDHPDVETVYQRVRKRMPTVSLDTVYRTLGWLKGLGLVTTIGSPRERSRFDANIAHHHHFVCNQCGLTQDFYSEQLGRLEFPESVKAIYHVDSIQVEVKGMCLNCAAKIPPEPFKKE